MQTLSSKGVLPNECSPNVQKVVEKIFLSELIFVNLNGFAKVYEGENSLLVVS